MPPDTYKQDSTPKELQGKRASVMSFPKCYTVGWGIYDTAVYSLRYGVYCFFHKKDKIKYRLQSYYLFCVQDNFTK